MNLPCYIHDESNGTVASYKLVIQLVVASIERACDGDKLVPDLLMICVKRRNCFSLNFIRIVIHAVLMYVNNVDNEFFYCCL